MTVVLEEVKMPIYEYVCSDCGLKFELLRRLSQSDDDASCPTCHKHAGRVLSTFACYSASSDGGSSTPIAGTGGCSCGGSCSTHNCSTCAS